MDEITHIWMPFFINDVSRYLVSSRSVSKQILKIIAVGMIVYGVITGNSINGTHPIWIAIITWILGNILINAIFPRKKTQSKKSVDLTSTNTTEKIGFQSIPQDSTSIRQHGNDQNAPKSISVGGKICPSCGNMDADPNANFCMLCGTSFIAPNTK